MREIGTRIIWIVSHSLPGGAPEVSRITAEEVRNAAPCGSNKSENNLFLLLLNYNQQPILTFYPHSLNITAVLSHYVTNYNFFFHPASGLWSIIGAF